MEVRARRSREASPDRARVYVHPKTRPFRKVQVLYYLCRNGQIEHPHFVEVSHLANQQLRLRDVMDRLTLLRGKSMASLFSWSCKRSYKNGYVWNDLAENDVIYPAEGAEYVLKGSELIEGCAERFQQLQVRNNQQNPEPNFQPKRKQPVGSQHREPALEVEDMREEEEEDDEEEEEEKGSYISSHVPYSRCSRGVSTDEIGDQKTHNNNNRTEISLDDASPPSTTSTVSEKAQENIRNSQRYEECDSVTEPMGNRNSVFFQLIACGSSVATKGRKAPVMKNAVNTNARKSSSLHKGVLCKTATKVIEEEINYMSENPRFGNPQSEEKEYFSGSIIESMTEERVLTEPVLKKSSSYNEERSLKSGLGETVEKVEEKGKRGNCLPCKKSSSKQSKK